MEQTSVQAQCDCGNEVMKVEYWEDEKSFCFIQFKYLPIKHSFSRRLKFLFAGQIHFNEIFLSPAKAKEIADFINKNI